MENAEAARTAAISKAHRSRGQRAHHARIAWEAAEEELETVKNQEGIQEEDLSIAFDRLETANQLNENYGRVVEECQELDGIEADHITDDPHYTGYLELFSKLDNIKAQLNRLRRIIVNSRRQQATPHGDTGYNQQSTLNTPRINTSLKPESLDAETSLADFRVWKKKFKDFFKSNKMETFEQADQRAHLHGCMTSSMINTMEKLLDVDDTLEVAEVVEKLEEYFREKVSLIRRRYDFHMRKQKEGEGFNNFFVTLKLLGEDAELDGITYEDQIIDRIVMGVKDKELQRELLQMSKPKLEDIKRKCQCWESSDHTQGDFAKANLNKLSTYKRSQLQNRSEQSKQGKCDRCGQDSHDIQACPAKDYTCKHCKIRGHFTTVCRKLKTEEHSIVSRDTNAESKATNAHAVSIGTVFVGQAVPSRKACHRAAGKTSPGKQEKEKTSSGKQTKGKTSPGKQEKEKTSSGKQTKGKTSPGKQEKEKTSPGKQTKGKTSPGKQEKEKKRLLQGSKQSKAQSTEQEDKVFRNHSIKRSNSTASALSTEQEDKVFRNHSQKGMDAVKDVEEIQYSCQSSSHNQGSWTDHQNKDLQSQASMHQECNKEKLAASSTKQNKWTGQHESQRTSNFNALYASSNTEVEEDDETLLREISWTGKLKTLQALNSSGEGKM